MNPISSDLRLHVFCNWMLRPQELGDFIDERIAFLRRLRDLHPAFCARLYMIGSSRKASPELAPDLSNVEPFMLKEGRTRDQDERWFIHLDTNGRATRETQSRVGFMLWIRDLAPREDEQLRIELNGGSTNPDQGGGSSIRLPHAGPPEFSNPEFLEELLLLLIDHWKPEQAGVYNHAVSGAVTIENSYATPLSWLNYLDDARVAEVLPPDVFQRRVDSGVLFRLQPEPPLTAETVATALPKAQRVSQALLPGEWMTKRYWRGKTPRPMSQPA